MVDEKEVIEALDEKGINDPEAKALLMRYVDQCHAEADREASADLTPGSSNRANLKAEMKITVLYSKTARYRKFAIESFRELYDAALQNETSSVLVPQILKLILNFRQPLGN